MAVAYAVAMRVHLSLDDDLVSELDRRVTVRERSAFVASAIRAALAKQVRQESLAAAIGSIPDHGHDWDEDPAGWVRRQRTWDRTPT